MHFGGGAERLVFDCYFELKKRGVTCGIVILEKAEMHGVKNGDFFEKALEREPHIYYPKVDIRLSLTGKNFPDVKEYQAILSNFNPNIIHSHLFLGELLARSVLWPGAKYFSHFHDNMHQLRSWQWNKKIKKNDLTDFYERKVLLASYKKCDNHFIAISSDSMRYAKKVLPKNMRNKITLIPNAINLEPFKKLTYNKPSSPYRLVNIGSLVEKKNQSFLIEALDLLIKKGIDVELELLGDGPDHSALLSLVTQKNLLGKVHFHGYADIMPILQNSHLYVHAALYEPFGLVLVEAMAAGLPIVCLDGKGNRGIVKNGTSGFFLKDPSIEEFADKILQILNSEQIHHEFHLKSKDLSQSYGIERYVDLLIDAYQKA